MITIEKYSGALTGTIALTPSKSITNRVLIIQALSANKFEIKNPATANDSLILRKILTDRPSYVDIEDAGTACRFLTAYLCCQQGGFLLTGSDRMKKRPIGSLVTALKDIGADILYEEKADYLPLRINGKKLHGEKVIVDASASSQFVSALMLIAPTVENGLSIEPLGKVASEPYVHMTAGIMRSFGVEVFLQENIIRIDRQKYLVKDFTVENDWSSASFWYIMAALSSSAEFKLEGLFQNSIQGDSIIVKIMEQFGIRSQFYDGGVICRKTHSTELTHLKYDFSDCPDLVIPVAVVCAASKVFAEFSGVKNLRLKESDRLAVIKSELEKAGSKVEVGEDSLKIIPGELIEGVTIESHNDHRIAMAFAALSMKVEISIDDENVVRKSYPEFWQQCAQIGLKINS
jgi:3-phosphoshikimate 1-carboxyvinyltransferase